MKGLDNEFINICKEIDSEIKNDKEWSLIESCNMFQTEHYCGGYDATEEAFCFSYYDVDGNEFWFQLNLVDIKKILSGDILSVEILNAQKI